VLSSSSPDAGELRQAVLSGRARPCMARPWWVGAACTGAQHALCVRVFATSWLAARFASQAAPPFTAPLARSAREQQRTAPQSRSISYMIRAGGGCLDASPHRSTPAHRLARRDDSICDGTHDVCALPSHCSRLCLCPATPLRQPVSAPAYPFLYLFCPATAHALAARLASYSSALWTEETRHCSNLL
jgi:hypothetical protein